MGFLEALGRVFGQHGDSKAGAEYDRSLWRKKLTRVLERLPDSQAEWEPLLAEARALKIDEAWVKGCQREEFSLLLHRAVADGVVTGMEHRKLDLARDLIGIPDDEAEQMLHAIAAEAEAFFGKQVKGT
ncbi:MAG TPA: hypothetical protein VGY53_07490 [Isosphaeraceae bacterium]|nr:hypothetical protein [Isosphaeraceae bacterium]